MGVDSNTNFDQNGRVKTDSELQNTASVVINPATEETLAEINDKIAPSSSTPVFFTGSVDENPIEVLFGGTTVSIMIRNRSMLEELRYSWDGINYGILDRGGIIGDNWSATSVYLKSNSSTSVEYALDVGIKT